MLELFVFTFFYDFSCVSEMNITPRIFEGTNKAIEFELAEPLEMISFTFFIHYKKFLCNILDGWSSYSAQPWQEKGLNYFTELFLWMFHYKLNHNVTF